MNDINTYLPMSGRLISESNSIVNVCDTMTDIAGDVRNFKGVSWSEIVTIAATNSYNGSTPDLNKDGLYDYTAGVDLENNVGAEVVLKYSSSGTTDNIVFSMFGSIDGADYDTIERYSMVCNSGSGVQISFRFTNCPPYVKFGVKTNGTTDTFDYKIQYRLWR